MSSRPDFGKMQLDIFQRKDPGGILWQPRLDYWYNVNKKRDTLPVHLQNASLLDVYDYCHASCRYVSRSNPWLGVRYRNVEVATEWLDDDRVRRTWHTPIGSLTQISHYDEWHVSSHIVEYRLKRPDDFKILKHLLEDEEWYWDADRYQQDMAIFGAYAAPQFYFRRSPLQRLFINEMSLQETIYFMVDYPDLFGEYVEFATAADDAMYDIICNCPVEILNLGENIDGFIDSPPTWRNYLVPYYRKRIEQLHAAGKSVSIHFDGVMKPLLPYLQEAPFDAIEAATPAPQGDVTLEEIKQALGDMILVDGIPALYFLADQYSTNTLIDCAHQVVEMFHPRLVLGVSDEVPPDSDIERVRLIGELAQEVGQ